MKLAIALVAASLSLAACAEQPTGRSGGPTGIGPGKPFNTDPTQIDVDAENETTDLANSWAEIVTSDNWKDICVTCNYTAIHKVVDHIEFVDLVDQDGGLVCHYSRDGVELPCDIAKRKY